MARYDRASRCGIWTDMVDKARYVSAAEAARLLGVNPSRVRQMAERGQIQGAYRVAEHAGRFRAVWRIPLGPDGLPVATIKRRPRKPK